MQTIMRQQTDSGALFLKVGRRVEPVGETTQSDRGQLKKDEWVPIGWIEYELIKAGRI